MVRLTAPNGHPNINELWRLAKDLEATKLTVKYFGYELAKALMASLPPLPPGGPFQMPATSRPATQQDLEANWSRYWSAQVRESHNINRRVWEHALVLQALHQFGKMVPGAKGLGFVTQGPLVSYLAGRGCEITAVDASAPTPQDHHRSELVSREIYDRNVKPVAADINALPDTLGQFDFCWSIGRLQHAGSLANGVNVVEKSADLLKPGGVLVHTAEFNFIHDEQTIDNWSLVLFQRRHFEEMAKQLTAKGCRVLPLDFNVGNRPLDRFIDVPPFDAPGANVNDWSRDATHIKASIDGFPCTSFGLIAVKG